MTIEIPAGMKTSKAINRFATEMSQNILNDVRLMGPLVKKAYGYDMTTHDKMTLLLSVSASLITAAADCLLVELKEDQLDYKNLREANLAVLRYLRNAANAPDEYIDDLPPRTAVK